MKKIMLILIGTLILFTSCGKQTQDDKPVIYLYPEVETVVNVQLDYEGTYYILTPSMMRDGQ